MKKNKQIIVTIGVPASGKSTWSKEFVKENPSYVKVERDDFRYGMKDISIGDKQFENFITELQFKAIHIALNNKYNVIVSDTNCNGKYLKILLEEFKYKADVTLKFFDTDLETCYARDVNRERSVGKNVIDRMFKGFKNVRNEFFDNNYFPKQEFIYSLTPFNEYLENCIIVDLDGTLAHANGKRGYYEWNKVGMDDVDYDVLEIVNSSIWCGNKIIFLTGRSNECYQETKKWLEKYLREDEFLLLMRDSKDFRPSVVVKKELYEKFVKVNFNVIFALDDKEDICEMWRSLGIKALQCLSDK
jgi:predicted kinase